jgi:hypothetical protein
LREEIGLGPVGNTVHRIDQSAGEIRLEISVARRVADDGDNDAAG